MKITLARLTTKDLATLAQRVIQISKNEKHQKTQQQNPLLADLEKKSQAYDMRSMRSRFLAEKVSL